MTKKTFDLKERLAELENGSKVVLLTEEEADLLAGVSEEDDDEHDPGIDKDDPDQLSEALEKAEQLQWFFTKRYEKENG